MHGVVRGLLLGVVISPVVLLALAYLPQILGTAATVVGVLVAALIVAGGITAVRERRAQAAAMRAEDADAVIAALDPGRDGR